MQTVYINQLFDTHKISNRNPASIFIVKELYLILAYDNFNLNPKNVSTYKQFIGNV